VTLKPGRRQSIGRQLVVAIFLTSGVALALACIVFVVYDAMSLRRATIQDVETLAHVVGLNTADALSFADPTAATLTLRSLAAAPEVIGAVVYDAGGREFASYRGEGSEPFEAPEVARAAGSQFGSGHLELSAPLTLEGEVLGSILIRWDTSALSRRVWSYLAIVGALLAVVFFVSLRVAAVLRSRVADPLAALVEGAQQIADGRLGTQVSTRPAGEIGTLAAAFNGMAQSLQDLVSRVHENIDAVSQVAQDLRGSSQEMSADVERQEAAIREASASVVQVTGSIRGVNENVDRLAQRSRETSRSIVEVDASINEVAGHMDELGEAIEGASSGTAQLGASVQQIGEAMETLESGTDQASGLLSQLARAVRAVAGNAKECGELSSEASQEALRGVEAVEETVSAMEEIRESFGRIEASVGGFAQMSDAIGEVLGVIESVVDKSNLLALNAAIIASQAGEHGRAFSIVAGEVRSLADHTARSTQEIASLVKNVQSETTEAVRAVTHGSETVERGVARSREAGGVLRSIMAKSNRTEERVSEIVGATVDQTGDIQEVEGAMKRVRGLVEQTNQSTAEQARVASSMGGVVERVRDLGQQVKRATAEQSRQSELITKAVHQVDVGVDQILQRSQEQARESATIHRALRVFGEVASEGTRRARNFESIVGSLSERAQRLKQAIKRLET
jgi:methyl-accepting chemotaxis protein